MQKELIRKGLVISVIVLFIGLAVIPSTGISNIEKTTYKQSTGITLYVGGSGSGNYSTIQSAIDDANNGDTVFVFDDSSPYYENVVIDKSINLIGEYQGTTVIDGGATSYVIRIIASSVQVRGFKIMNCEDWKSNIYMEGVHDCLITDNIVIGNEFGLIDGIEIEYSYDNTIRNNSITNFYQSGIHLYYSTHNIIENNVVTSCHYRGILIHYHCNDNNITKNSCIDTGNGIEIHTNCEGNYVFENIVSDNSGGIFLHKVGGNDVYNNSIFNNGFGIGTQYSHDNEIYSNTLTNNSKGVYIQHDSYDNTISENYIGDHEIGVKTYQSTSNNILSNTIVNNQKGITIDSRTNNLYIFENNIYDNNIGIKLSATTQNIISNNFLKNFESSILLEGSYDNMISQNTIQESLTGIKSLYSTSNFIIENTFSDNKCGINLTNCSDFSITENIIERNTYGIKFQENAKNNIAKKNVIKKNICGIFISDSTMNVIIHNEFRVNRGMNYYPGGVMFLRSFDNNVSHNNFKRNIPDAWFILSNNTWYNNYWSRPYTSEKAIYGIGSNELPWVNYDYYPRIKPYNLKPSSIDYTFLEQFPLLNLLLQRLSFSL